MNDEITAPFDSEFSPEHFPLIDELDHEILMHRDAHFGGQFSFMLDYYKQERKGVQPEFSRSRIEKLALLEEQLKQNLAALFLTAQEMQKVADARAAYQKLRSIYAVNSPKNIHPHLIADLILSEEEEAEKEINAIVSEKDKIVPTLIELLRSEEFYDPLFPGYGKASAHVVKCLEQIGDKRAIISLFEAIGQKDFFVDDLIIKALKAINAPAKTFLLNVLKSKPITEDNEKAAIALLAFKEEEEEVANACFELLQQEDVLKDPCLPTYLVLVCTGLQDPIKKQMMKVMSLSAKLPAALREDIKQVMKEWKA